MSKTLNLVDMLLAQARRLHESGRLAQAATLFRKLTALRTLPRDVAEEAQSALADIQFLQGEFARARRHLHAAIMHQPSNAEYHRRLGAAVESDPDGAPARALAEYTRCVKLDPKNAAYWCDHAHAALNVGHQQAALRSLRRAQSLAPDNAEVLDRVVAGLLQLKLEGEARDLVRAAMFRNPRDYRFRTLWHRLQFEMLHARQQAARPAPPRQNQARPRMILPFRLPYDEQVKLGGKTIRCDAPATLKGPSPRAPRRPRSGKRQ